MNNICILKFSIVTKCSSSVSSHIYISICMHYFILSFVMKCLPTLDRKRRKKTQLQWQNQCLHLCNIHNTNMKAVLTLLSSYNIDSLGENNHSSNLKTFTICTQGLHKSNIKRYINIKRVAWSNLKILSPLQYISSYKKRFFWMCQITARWN